MCLLSVLAPSTLLYLHVIAERTHGSNEAHNNDAGQRILDEIGLSCSVKRRRRSIAGVVVGRCWDPAWLSARSNPTRRGIVPSDRHICDLWPVSDDCEALCSSSEVSPYGPNGSSGRRLESRLHDIWRHARAQPLNATLRICTITSRPRSLIAAIHAPDHTTQHHSPPPPTTAMIRRKVLTGSCACR